MRSTLAESGLLLSANLGRRKSEFNGVGCVAKLNRQLFICVVD